MCTYRHNLLHQETKHIFVCNLTLSIVNISTFRSGSVDNVPVNNSKFCRNLNRTVICKGVMTKENIKDVDFLSNYISNDCFALKTQYFCGQNLGVMLVSIIFYYCRG